MKRTKHMALSLVAVLLSCLTAGCGRAEEEAPRSDAGDFVYVSESLPNSAHTVTNFSATENHLFFLRQENNSYTVCRIPLSEIGSETDFSDSETALALPAILSSLPENAPAYDFAGILDYATDTEQNLYCLAALYKGSISPELVCGILYKQSPEGGLLYCRTLPDLQAPLQLADLIAIDSDGRPYVLQGSSILMLDKNGEAGSVIALENNLVPDADIRIRLLADSQGHIYYTAENYINYTRDTYLLEGSRNPRPTQASKLSGRLSMRLFEAPGGLLVQSDDDILCRYDQKADSLSEILKWEDSNLLGKDLQDVTQLAENSFLVSLQSSDRKELLLLTRTSSSQFPQKEEIVIASFFPSTALKQSVVDFNLASAQYHVSIETYGADFYSGDENAAAVTLLDASLVSGNGPDLLDLSSLEVSKYAEGKMLEDLYSYINNDDLFDKERYLDHLLEGYTINGKLVCIPKSFSFRSLWAVDPRALSVEEWTLPEVMALTERYPETPLLMQSDYEYMLETFCSPYFLEHFVDWEKGEASFDSAEFCHILTWIKAQTRKTVAEDETELAANSWTYQFIDYLSMAWRYDTDTAMRGYPSADGEGRFFVMTTDALSILSDSRHKEGAWEFLRHFLSEDTYGNGFPTRRDLLAELAEEAVTPRYALDEKGNRVKNSEGEDWILPKGNIYINGEPLEFFALEQEQADAVMDAIAKIDFSPRTGTENTVIEIILQEANDFFNGPKTEAQVAAVIQNRVRTLLQENSLKQP